MATFKFTVFKERMRADRTWNVFIRFTHERKTRYIATTMYVSKKDLTPSFKIKNQSVIDKCEDLIREYRKRIASLNLELNDMDIDSIVEELKRRKDENKGIDFVAFAREWCRRRTDIKGVKNYITAINLLCMFFGRDKIFCSEITVNKMREFEDYLQDRKRAQSLYPQSIQRIFNEAREYYNDEENGIVRIRQSLSRYKPKQQNVAEKRAVDAETVYNPQNEMFACLKRNVLFIKTKRFVFELYSNGVRMLFDVKKEDDTNVLESSSFFV